MNILILIIFTMSNLQFYIFSKSCNEKYSYVVKIKPSNRSISDLQTHFSKYGIETTKKLKHLIGNYYHISQSNCENRRNKRETNRISNLYNDETIEWIQKEVPLKRTKRDLLSDSKYFNDPLFNRQWYLKNDKSIDINVFKVWEKGITGKNVVITILDDGIEYNHTDLIKNYDPLASWDINDDDENPSPRYDEINFNKHGTRCAGEVAAAANNDKCGVGIAYNSKIGGVRMLDGKVTDRVEAESLSISSQHIDIYSSSWGPMDDGKTVEGPGLLAEIALKNGITKGRNSLGSIFIWASGNGGHHFDDCNCDGYANSIYTITISSTTENGDIPWYSESCAATLASTPSSGINNEKRIITTDLHDTCTQKHTGTSASAPIAAGIVALALEVNPQLTWRDVIYLLIWSANPYPLDNNKTYWSTNGANLRFHKYFGFGLIDSYKLVSIANHSDWRSVGSLSNICETETIISEKLF